jgi:two-component system phosphate regulon sensor histidine kinase PhoR
VGKSINDIKDNFRFPSLIDNIQQVIGSNEILEKEIQTTDLRWYQMNIIPYVSLKNNKTNGVIITFVEITRRIKDLKEQERLISDHETLLDTISHDIKAPITNLVLAIDLFKNVSPDDNIQFKALLNILENAIKKMQNIIDELTDTRKKEHKYKAQEELLNFENILEDVRLTLSDNIKESGATIKSEVNISEITFSRRKLRSIVYNLISNAIKFRTDEKPPVISVKAEKLGKQEKDKSHLPLDRNYLKITIKDNGIGFEPDYKEKIFQIFQTLSPRDEVESTGIGLALVQKIIELHKGHVWLDSVEHEGTIFYFTLPKTMEENSHEE